MTDFFSKIKWRYFLVLILGILIAARFTPLPGSRGFTPVVTGFVFFWPAKPAAAKFITIQSRGFSFQVVTNTADVASVLSEQGITLEEIVVTPLLQTRLTAGMVIEYRHPISIRLVDAGKETVIGSSAMSVEEALTEQGISLSPKDEISPPVSAPVHAGMNIVIRRITESEEVRVEPIAYPVVIREDREMLYGRETVVGAGVAGKQEMRYLVRYKDGKEVSRRQLSAKVVTQPVSKIIQVGRKIVIESYELGKASWYRNKNCLCAAHPYYPKGSYLQVTSLATAKSLIVLVNDYGPNQQVHSARLIDLDAEAFKLLAPLSVGTMDVKVEKLQSN